MLGYCWKGKGNQNSKCVFHDLAEGQKLYSPSNCLLYQTLLQASWRFTFTVFPNNQIVNIQVKQRLMDRCHRHDGGLVICSNKSSLCKCPSTSPAICFCASCFSPIVFSRVQGHYIVWPQTNLNVDRAKSANLSEYTQPDPPCLFSWKYTRERGIFQCI